MPNSFLNRLQRRGLPRLDWPEPVGVPYPPPLELRPASDRAVVTVAAGELGRSLLEISGPLMKRYAARLGADFVVSTWPGVPDWPMSCKYGVARAFDHYERVVYLDCDVLVRESAIDLFAECPENAVGLVDELPAHGPGKHWGVELHYRCFRQHLGLADEPVAFYFNSGVVVATQAHRNLFHPPADPLPSDHCAEQHLLNCRLAAGVADGSLQLAHLPPKANWQHWTDCGFRTAPTGAVLHFSGTSPGSREKLMRRWAVAE